MLCDLSKNEDISNNHKEVYQEALDNCGYDHEWEFKPSDKGKRTRIRKVL